jgi:hypothetical protein
MFGEWLRVTPAELERVIADPSWGYQFARDADYREYRTEGISISLAEHRSFGTTKTFHALSYLLRRNGFPVEVVLGEQYLTEDDAIEWGYGRPFYLTVDEVRHAADALSEVTEESLLDGVTADDLIAEKIYPTIWDRPNQLPWAVSALEDTKTWFTAAAAAGDAVICFIS